MIVLYGADNNRLGIFALEDYFYVRLILVWIFHSIWMAGHFCHVLRDIYIIIRYNSQPLDAQTEPITGIYKAP